jgi:hypothetical protein
MKTIKKYTFIFLVVLILLIVAFCTRSWADSMSIRTGPSFGVIYTVDNFATISLDYEKMISEKYSIAGEVQRFYRASPGSGDMWLFSGIIRRYLKERNVWGGGTWRGYGLAGGGVAFPNYEANSEGDMLFNLVGGIGVEYRYNWFALTAESRITHQSNSNLGHNDGTDGWGYFLGAKYYFKWGK